MNRVILTGRLTRDPELRYTPSGVAVATFTLAVDRPKQKDKEKEADFPNIVAWRTLGENCANYLKKGRKAAVEGRLQTRRYETDDGRKVFVTEVVADNVEFLDPADKRDATPAPSNDDQTIDISDDDLPF